MNCAKLERSCWRKKKTRTTAAAADAATEYQRVRVSGQMWTTDRKHGLHPVVTLLRLRHYILMTSSRIHRTRIYCSADARS